MKRELNVKNFMIGILVLGISTNGFAEAPEVQAHVEGPGGSATATVRAEQEQKQLPGDLPYEGLLSSLNENAGKLIKTQVVPIGGSPLAAEVQPESLEKIQKWVEGFKGFRVELEACDRDKDAGAKALAKRLDEYTKKLRWALFEKKDATTGKVEIQKEADIKTLVTLSTQIKELLAARGERLKSDAHKPFASEQEKKIANWVDSTNSIFMTAYAQLAVENPREKEALDKVVADAKQGLEADVTAFKEVQEVDVCKLGAKPDASEDGSSSRERKDKDKPVQDDNQVLPPGGKQPPATTPPGPQQPPQVFGPVDASGALAALEAQAARERAEAANLINENIAEQARLAAEAQRRQAELDALALQAQNDNEALKALVGALGQNNNDQPVIVPPPPPPPPISPAPISTGDSGQPLPTPNDPGAPPAAAPMILPPYGQQNASTPVYPQSQGPSQFATNDNQNRYSSLLPVNPQQGAMAAVNALLAAARGGMFGLPGQVGAATANVMQSRLSGLSAGNPLRNAQVRGQAAQKAATGAIVGATSGPAALQASGRAKTVPSDFARAIKR